MAKYIINNGCAYPSRLISKIEPSVMETTVRCSSIDLLNVNRVSSIDVVFNVYVDGVKGATQFRHPANGSVESVYLPEDEDFVEWLSEQQLKSGKDPVKVFKNAVLKVNRIKMAIAECEKAKQSNEKVVETVAPVVQQAEAPVAVQLTPRADGEVVDLDVALKDLSEEPELPFEPQIVAPKSETFVNEELEEFNQPTVSDEDMHLLHKKTAFIEKMVANYIAAVNALEPETKLITAVGRKQPDQLTEYEESIVSLTMKEFAEDLLGEV